MFILKILYSTFQYVLFFYFTYSTIYNLTLAVASLFTRKLKKNQGSVYQRFCVLIPAYKEDGVIIESVEKALLQDYSSDVFKIFVIADSLQKGTLQKLKSLPVEVIVVSFEISTKVKALNAALDSITEHFDGCVLLDADNHMDRNFLKKANELLGTHYLSIQGQRLPKNTSTTMSFLDGLSESINTNIFRKGSFNIGLSSSISGSGYVADFSLIKNVFAEMDSVSGFDKELEIKLLMRGVSTAYTDELIIYDEKVSTQKDFKNQRRRWIYSQYFYLAKYLKTGIKAFFTLNFSLWNSSFLRHAQLPRFINLVILAVFSILFPAINYFISMDFKSIAWVAILSLNLLSILIAIPGKYYTKQLLLAALKLPITFINMFSLLFKLKGANKRFIHTPHRTNGESQEN